MEKDGSLLPVFAGTVGIAVVLSQFMQYFPTSYFVGSVWLSVFTGAAYAVEKLGKSRLDKYFHAANFKNAENTFAEVKHKLKTENGIDYHVKVPLGLCKSDFEKDKEAMEHAMGASIRYEIEKEELVLKTTKTKLKEFYKFEPIFCEKPLEICPAYTAFGEFHFDIEEAIHTLIAGETGWGKSVAIRAILTALILTKSPQDVRINLVDLKLVEQAAFRRCEMVDDYCVTAAETSGLLDKMETEFNGRMKLFEKSGVVNIQDYNKKHQKNKLPYIINVFDEIALLSQKKDADCKAANAKLIQRLAVDRCAGIYYILCTQHPVVEILNGAIKANAPCRIAVKTASKDDSKVILDENGAELLKRRGNALFKISEMQEIQFMYLSVDDAISLVKKTYVYKPKKIETEVEEIGVIGIVDQERQRGFRIH